MKKIISIVGPTASGKTSYALDAAHKVLQNNFKSYENYSGVDLISVDSRQVYKDLEILSGADIPENFELVVNESVVGSDKSELKLFKFFKHKDLEITLHGVSIINLDDEWSVAHFKDFATKIILNSFKNNRLPILVGGTGLYHKHLFQKDQNLYVPPNDELRAKANKMTLHELQAWLKKVNQVKLEKMNNSDINNPRRLIRAIEISLGTPELNNDLSLPDDVELETIVVGVELEKLKEKILARVKERFAQGALDEVKNLLKVCEQKDLPVCSTLGVGDIKNYLLGNTSKEDCINNWSLHEYQYSKRQLTWFKKQAE